MRPVQQRLLPLDDTWRRRLTELPWPSANLPEVMGEASATLRALIREYLFVSLFRACAESLASENASRLAAMERADRNIDELLETLNGSFHRLRQSGIDEELFDVISGFEALGGARQLPSGLKHWDQTTVVRDRGLRACFGSSSSARPGRVIPHSAGRIRGVA